MEKSLAIMPAMELEQAIERHNQLIHYVKKIMKEGIDFGKIEGTDKNTLYKPGAEKLNTFFGLTVSFELIDCSEEWKAQEPFFNYRYRCNIHHGERLVSSCEGSCSSATFDWR